MTARDNVFTQRTRSREHTYFLAQHKTFLGSVVRGVRVTLVVVPSQHRTFLASVRSLSIKAREHAFSAAVTKKG
jgi:hypothetical protein